MTSPKKAITVVTPQEISDHDEELRQQREKLTLFTRPVDTMRLFSASVCSLTSYVIKSSISHPAFLYFIIPLLLLWVLSKYIPGPYTDAINQVEFGFEFLVWWVGLGIMSSIGLGSGLQSGVLFLFPHIIKTCLAAQTCKTTDFVSTSNMWFRSPSNLFKCPVLVYESTPVTFYGLWHKVFFVCFLQAAGTAIGEIPPFYMTRAARLAAISAGTSTLHDDDVPEDLQLTSSYTWINRAKSWMVKFLRTYGFYGVLVMASYPNIAFDLCGICCGHYLMPFWTFFIATFLGKACIRNTYQSIIYVTLCSEKYLQKLIKLLQYLTPDSLQIDEIIRDVLEEGRSSFQNTKKDSAEPSSSAAAQVMFWWQIFMSMLLITFGLSCISQFAQFYQMTLDQAKSNKLRELLPSNVKASLLSPSGSGRLILPPPTPKTRAKSPKISKSSVKTTLSPIKSNTRSKGLNEN